MKFDADWKLKIKVYDKQDDFNFFIDFNISNQCSTIPFSRPYGAHVSQLIQYTRRCSAFDQAFNLGSLLTNISTLQGFLQSRQPTDKHVDITGVSTVSFTGCFP
jgi:hypothetical protein